MAFQNKFTSKHALFTRIYGFFYFLQIYDTSNIKIIYDKGFLNYKN